VTDNKSQTPRQLTIISGKGGTGKTTFTAAFAQLTKDKVMADCDVDAADLHLILTPKIQKTEAFFGGRSPVVDLEHCTKCGVCTELCRYDAIHDGVVDLFACDNCGLCAHACPEKIITMEEVQSGDWFVSDTRFGPMVHAKLGIAEENSGKLVTMVRKEAIALAKEKALPWVIVDGPPGIGCPVTAALAGVSKVLIVTEPSLSGIHDMERVLALTEHFRIPAQVCINKYDIHLENTRQIETYCLQKGIEVVGKVPFNRGVIDAMVKGKTVIEREVPEVTQEIKNLWQRVMGSGLHS
jgi:MinD superfamily P-loop ATPase